MSNSGQPFACLTPRSRENRTQEIDTYLAEGKIPVDVDLSQHPERSVEARGCVFLIPFGGPGYRTHFADRADGEGCRVHQRYQDCPRDVSRHTSHHLLSVQT